ncbi:hypothetical protein V5F41_08250 [Xanthobacter autotrophicus]|uniref:hypothetical protein n=1 Tax=Xanthobacter autotrophicus TaxID=280 RepID=UPI00372BE519
MDARQESVDAFYWRHGNCCAGCDWWKHITSMAGECMRSAPVPGHERASMIGIQSASFNIGAGHIITPRDHHCGEFVDTFDWSSLGPFYLRRIGARARIAEIEAEDKAP